MIQAALDFITNRGIGVVGIFAILASCVLISAHRKHIDWRTVAAGLMIQLCFAILILKTPLGTAFFIKTQLAVTTLIEFSDQGATFVFGEGFREHFFAFKVTSTIIFTSSVASVLFYLGILQKTVAAMSWCLRKFMHISGVEGLVACANVFIGQTESPLFVKAYIPTMTRSEIMVMMTSGMATVAGGVLAAFVDLGFSAGHLVAASFMSAPASLVSAKIIYPETENASTRDGTLADLKSPDQNLIDSAVSGASQGAYLAINVGAVLIAFIGLIALVNALLALVVSPFGLEATLQGILGFILTPLAWVIGIPWEDCSAIGSLLGQKIILNEFYSYIELGKLIEAGSLNPRSVTIATYGLCGFASFSSIAIQIGGIGNLCPERRVDLAQLGMRAMIGGNLAAFLTAAIAGLLI